MDMDMRADGIREGREPRSAGANLLVFLALLPLDALVGGYAWLVVGIGGWAAAHNGAEAAVPVMELVGSGGVLAAVGLALCWGRYRGAAVAQFVLTGALMAWLLSPYG
ncbi:hypothetical protein OH797_35040 [Streptomyces anulatus]|uniref:hypothetical protein n=1 Tax=Streptomyces TaxID=1883 RepID=UPI000BFDBD9D|nr:MULTISPECIES: hypothetical protein [Streptomyces]MDF9802078.1 hypothetical protein [Streptomyces sp. HB372]MBT1104134.1 hypothetical protein [Streptomyces sp. Tu10]WSC59804.1 hypothetical protein OHA57_03265 [Streptomyces anulatus]WSR74222.1 hypothetical protein OG274_02940 [Streptomyces anulatus]WTC67550.1 hypothetical protein OG865_35555 [Streptomyces anulatus]